METVVKKAWNFDTEEAYEIELPANSVVKKGLLKLDYPPDGIHKRKIAEMLADQFELTSEQRNAKYKSGNRVFHLHIGIVTSSLIKSGEMVKPKTGWRNINRSQASVQDGAIEKSVDNSSGTSEESIEGNYQRV